MTGKRNQGPAAEPHVELTAELHGLVDVVRQDLRSRERAAGASMPVLRAAAAISARPGLGSSELADVLRLDRSTVSNLLRDMQSLGLVRRRRLSDDRRFVSLELTTRGDALLLATGRPGTGLLSRAIARMDARAVQRLLDALAPLLDAIHAEEPGRLR